MLYKYYVYIIDITKLILKYSHDCIEIEKKKHQPTNHTQEISQGQLRSDELVDCFGYYSASYFLSHHVICSYLSKIKPALFLHV